MQKLNPDQGLDPLSSTARNIKNGSDIFTLTISLTYIIVEATQEGVDGIEGRSMNYLLLNFS